MHKPTDLRRDGWRVIYRDGRVIVQRGTDVFSTTIDGGRWMERPFESWVGATTHERREILAVASHCYCSTLPGTSCDFCSNVRRLPLDGARFAAIWNQRGAGGSVDHLLLLHEARAVREEWDALPGDTCWQDAFHALWRRTDPAGHAERFKGSFYETADSMRAEDDDEVTPS